MLLAWIDRHAAAVLVALTVLAVLLRVLLVWDAPRPFGYVWDFYIDGVRIVAREGRLPMPSECWQCSHPPLFYALGWAIYAPVRYLFPGGDDAAAVRALGAIAIVSAIATIYYGDRLLRLFGCRGASRVAGVSLLLICPCLFISTYAPEGDILLTALLSAFLFYLTRDDAAPASSTTTDAVRLGVLAGLAAATKYSGLVAPVSAAILFALRLRRPALRARTLHHGAIVALLCVLVGGWKYLDNYRRYGTPMYEVGSAGEGFSLKRSAVNPAYEFTTLRLGELRALMSPYGKDGQLSSFPVYDSVPTTLHALAWSDMSFFSQPSRHGDPMQPYPRKWIPADLSMAVIELGFVVDAVVVIGLMAGLRHRLARPLLVWSVVGFGAYFWWLLPQTDWALKTKYVLFLLPAAAVYFVLGLSWLARRAPVAAWMAIAAYAVLVVVAHIYLYAFAVGHF